MALLYDSLLLHNTFLPEGRLRKKNLQRSRKRARFISKLKFLARARVFARRLCTLKKFYYTSRERPHFAQELCVVALQKTLSAQSPLRFYQKLQSAIYVIELLAEDLKNQKVID